ncbi:MAG: T9SS type A sorting domain-containing protein [Bacteroidota bacterium]
MKHLSIFIAGLLLCNLSKAQLFINSDITIQNGATVYVDDTIQLASSSAVVTNGILQSTKSINTNGYVINTGTSGFIITPIASGIAKSFDIGTTSNNKIQIQHATGSAVVFQLAVRDSVYTNPITNTSYITTNVVNKRWYVAPQSSVSTLTGTAFWNAADESSGFLRGNCGVSYWQSGSSTAWAFTNGTAAATTTGSTPAYSKTASTAGLTAGIYYFGVGGFGSALPVSLLSFDAIKNINDDVLLKWITTSEVNNDHFELERSVDGSKFTVIAKVKGAGNSNSQINYLHKDETPFAKLNATKLYYRIKQVDMDGNPDNYRDFYTEIKEVDLQNVNSLNSSSILNITTYPNPNKDLLNIDIETSQQKNVTLNLFDANGRNIINQKQVIEIGKQTYQLNTSQLAPGIYLLNIINENNASVSKQKLIIY